MTLTQERVPCARASVLEAVTGQREGDSGEVERRTKDCSGGRHTHLVCPIQPDVSLKPSDRGLSHFRAKALTASRGGVFCGIDDQKSFLVRLGKGRAGTSSRGSRQCEGRSGQHPQGWSHPEPGLTQPRPCWNTRKFVWSQAPSSVSWEISRPSLSGVGVTE